MNHTSYFDRYDLEELTAQYMKIDFSREIHESEITTLRNQVKDLRAKLEKAPEIPKENIELKERITTMATTQLKAMLTVTREKRRKS